ncbi:SDR family oxidoreductase [uncultured Sphingomonas sp.]|uniref:SDR family oxidoreductase n=1 Tax=uncultured Sphingomonas sp. TaxID=158754 RepID=UPI0035CA6645
MGKVIAITGASSGMGAATARYLAARGDQVVLGARGADRLAAVTERIVAAGGEAAQAVIDVTRRADLARLVALAGERFGRLDVLVSNAGAMPIGPIDDLAVDDWERMVDVNIKGVLYGIAAALPVFRAQGTGHFITIASTAARKTVPGQSVYSCTKAAVVALSDGLRQELAGAIRVTVILPGFTDTDFVAHVKDEALRAQLEQAGAKFAMSPEAIAQAIGYAIDQPAGVNVGEIVVRSTAQP